MPTTSDEACLALRPLNQHSQKPKAAADVYRLAPTPVAQITVVSQVNWEMVL